MQMRERAWLLAYTYTFVYYYNVARVALSLLDDGLLRRSRSLRSDCRGLGTRANNARWTEIRADLDGLMSRPPCEPGSPQLLRLCCDSGRHAPSDPRRRLCLLAFHLILDNAERARRERRHPKASTPGRASALDPLENAIPLIPFGDSPPRYRPESRDCRSGPQAACGTGQNALLTTPPSTRRAAPVVADDSGLAT